MIIAAEKETGRELREKQSSVAKKHKEKCKKWTKTKTDIPAERLAA